MSLRSTLRKAAGLLVELPPEAEAAPGEETPVADAAARAGSATDKMWAELERAAETPGAASASAPAKTVEQIVREKEGPNLDQIRVTATDVPAPTGPGDALDFGGIYRAANLPTVPFTCEQVLEMLAALPADVPLDTRRQMMKVSIGAMGKAIGASPENIVADASRKLAALAAYTDHLASLTSEYTHVGEQKIAALQAQIEETRKGITAARERQERETQQCTAESHRLDEVLEFFSLDVPPSKYATSEGKENAG